MAQFGQPNMILAYLRKLHHIHKAGLGA